MRESADYPSQDRGRRSLRCAQSRSRRGGESGGAADAGRFARAGTGRRADRLLQPVAVAPESAALDRFRGRIAAAADRQALQAPVARSVLGQQDLAERVRPARMRDREIERGGAVHHQVRHFGATANVAAAPQQTFRFRREWSQRRASSATRISLSPNCQSSHWLGRLPQRRAMVSSIPIGQLRPKNVEGIMRSVQALAGVALLLLPALDVASAGEPKQGGILRVYHRDRPACASILSGAIYLFNIYI